MLLGTVYITQDYGMLAYMFWMDVSSLELNVTLQVALSWRILNKKPMKLA